MQLPTMDEAKEASKEQLARWYRFGAVRHDTEHEYEDIAVINFIIRRFHDLGGFDPELSKKIGWDEP